MTLAVLGLVAAVVVEGEASEEFVAGEDGNEGAGAEDGDWLSGVFSSEADEASVEADGAGGADQLSGQDGGRRG